MDLRDRALKIKLLLLDVDGVLTDGRLYYTSRGEEIKVFNVRDGLGIKLAQRAGIRIGVISGRKSKALINRLKELKVDEVHLGYNQKLPILEDVMKRLSLSLEEIAFLGDDYVDLPILRRVGFPMTVVDAPEEIKEHALYITNSKGGHGAVRDAIEFILKLRGQWEEVISQYYA
ncbi:KdsC family phosphatase [Pampinifervens florentissimum]|uniref:KdsC family phosphatase n=1 Tax=Pampinifervens florentissimum TaxID=1632019 RepID=UPI0013B48562|nr:HAD-IIIA family hydrolase [Hydrogenobacter sp. T-8]QID33537.1 HAD-IIIA family hydrolase [Hydrogenobacter sp. T-8]